MDVVLGIKYITKRFVLKLFFVSLQKICDVRSYK